MRRVAKRTANTREEKASCVRRPAGTTSPVKGGQNIYLSSQIVTKEIHRGTRSGKAGGRFRRKSDQNAVGHSSVKYGWNEPLPTEHPRTLV